DGQSLQKSRPKHGSKDSLGEGLDSWRDGRLPRAARTHVPGSLKSDRNDGTGRRARRAQSRGKRAGRDTDASPPQPGAEPRLRPSQAASDRTGGAAEDAAHLRVGPALQEAEDDRGAVLRGEAVDGLVQQTPDVR